MASTSSSSPSAERIIDIDVEQEMQDAFLEYAYSVIYSRALPDARDGLKPVQRRILYGMHELGLRPEKGHVKSSRIVGDVMGKYHPHGDSAIYDALVRMAQPFTMRVPLVDGHGNFGSLDDGPAAARYTEARMSTTAMALVHNLDENTVDFVPTYDDQSTQPDVMPTSIPNLLVNGASGIAVGMATNMPPHNLGEVVAAARHLLKKPDSTVEELMKFVPGPDFPCGGRIVGLDGIRDAYATGRGTFRTRATVSIEQVSPRRQAIVVTELPFLVGPEKIREKLKDLVTAKKIQGIGDFKDLTDLTHGLRLVIEIKNGFNPEAVLEQLYRLTPLEDSFGINNVALVEGQPRTLGLKALLEVFLTFRHDVVKRRSQFRLDKHQARLHLVEGLLIAILDIDEVIRIVRGSEDSAAARTQLMERFSLSEAQATYILDLQLRRLTKFSVLELEHERDELAAAIAALQELLSSTENINKVVSDELAEVARLHGTPRRTQLLESAGAPAVAAPLEMADDPCWVLISSTGRIARTPDRSPLTMPGRAPHDAWTHVIPASVRGDVAVVTADGLAHRVHVIEVPAVAPTAGGLNMAVGAPLSAFLAGSVAPPVGAYPLGEAGGTLAIGTEQGVVKRVAEERPPNRSSWEVISLKDGDRVVGAVFVPDSPADLVFITRHCQLLRFPTELVRPQGRTAGGMAGIKLAEGDSVLWWGVVPPDVPSVVLTVAGQHGATSTVGAGLKVAAFDDFPRKGRATAGVRCHRLQKGEEGLIWAWAGPATGRAADPQGAPLELPAPLGRRDGSGNPTDLELHAVAGPLWGLAPVNPLS